MNARKFIQLASCAVTALVVTGCVAPQDNTVFREHPPRSILVLPPLNETTKVEATYSYLSTVTRPLAEMGYYVFPVVLVDELLKANGMPTAGEMHQVALDKVAEITGADAVLYVNVKEYGTTYRVLGSRTEVAAEARLVDTKTGLLLWQGKASDKDSSANTGDLVANLIVAVISQAINSSRDAAHGVSREVNVELFMDEDRGLPYGPYHPKYGQKK